MEWIFAYNKKYYDLDRAIHELKGIDWLAKNKVEVGDIVYLYSSVPEQFIKYKCIVTWAGKNRTTYDETPYGGTPRGALEQCFEIKLEYEFKKPITIDELAAHGLSKKRVPTTSENSKPEVFEFIRERELQDKDITMTQTEQMVEKGINTALAPELINEIDGITYIKCITCGCQFIKAPRCPECGQLQKYEG